MHNIICSDMEGVYTPEVWIKVAEETGIKELRLTTRDISDYDVLMTKRLEILKEHNIKLFDIQKIIEKMEPLKGAREFLDSIRCITQIILVSDTFIQFADSMMRKLGRPTLFCNSLCVEPDGTISGYRLRQKNGKKKIAAALKSLNYKIIGIGDSYNDIQMLKESDSAILFNPPDKVKNEFPEFEVSYNYGDLETKLKKILEKI